MEAHFKEEHQKEIRIACFTRQGEMLGRSLKAGAVTRFPDSGKLSEWVQRSFQEADALIFIGACGIAVRAIAPFIKSKQNDPAVIVIDETGQYVIPVLSGHMGGANDLAELIASRTGSHAVITTATDRRNAFAADSWAKKNGFGIVNPEAVKHISASVLDGDEILLSVCRKEESVSKNIALRLVPKTVVIGAGCRKGTDPEYMERCFQNFSSAHAIEPASIACFASIDLKKEEPALVNLARRRKVPFLTFSAQELMKLEGVFSASRFVLETTGADNVCERAAVAALLWMDAEKNDKLHVGADRLFVRKESFEGVTFAAARARRVSSWEWE